MKIGLMTTPTRPVPPKERSIHAPKHMVADLADGLVDKGHAVYLFASKYSKTKATLCDFGIEPTSVVEETMPLDLYEKKVHEDEATLFQKMISYGIKQKIDVYHLHQVLFMEPLISASPSTCRFVITLHDPISGKYKDAVYVLSKHKNCFFVTLTNAQRGDVTAPFIATVPHGIRT
ncbi:glycosyltransferase, partial [Patescibacteria group bacterium]|nr:glycosyltransferase [Patescibacteria group bacterium]